LPADRAPERYSNNGCVIFQRLNQDLGITIIVVTHEPLIAEHTGRIVRLLDGRLSSDGAMRRAKDAAGELVQAIPA
jgi:ABC-type lipoprotein export system ATPase subunit